LTKPIISVERHRQEHHVPAAFAGFGFQFVGIQKGFGFVFAGGKIKFQKRGLLRVVPSDQDFHEGASKGRV
jgi:hypothetical protein